MDYKELVERLNEWNENLISKLCADDVLTCDDLCGCTGDCIVVQAATAITDLLARAEAAEEDRDRMREAMKPNCLLCDSMHENGNCTEVGGFCTAVPAAHCPLIPKLRNKLAAVEARAENAERERDEFKKKWAEAVNRACELSKIVDDHGWEE